MTKFQQQLIKRIASKKKNGFTMIELMIVVAIIGVLSAVAIPEFGKAQARAESTAARAEAVTAGKVCAIALIGGDSDEIDDAAIAEVDSGKITNAAFTCGKSDGSTTYAAAFTGGGDTWTVTMNGVGTPSAAVKS